MSSSRTRIAALIGAIVVIAAIGAGIVWYTSRDTPDEVDLQTAAQEVEDRATSSTTATDDPDATSSTEPGDLDGTWNVDRESGEFDYESATGSFVGFRVQEELVGIGAAEAVGRTGEVTGSITIEGTTVTDASFEVDMSTITTNESRRDSRVHQALNTETNPTATFVLTQPIELGEDPASGDELSVDAVGELTVNGTTRAVTIPLQAQLVADTVVVVGSTDITFSEFGVQVPSAPVVVSADDHGVLELQLLFVRD